MLHNHQPVGNFGWVVEENWQRAYEPMIAALERHPSIRAGLHYTGPLVEWARRHQPEGLARVAALVKGGQVELLGGAWYEPVLAALPVADRARQLVRMADEVEAWSGHRPRGAWLAERVWEPCLAFDLAEAGYEYTVLDDSHLRAASIPDDQMWATYSVDDQGRRLTVFGTEQGLRYAMPWRPVPELIEYLRAHATPDGDRVGVMGDDGEKFGGWPGTFESCWGAGDWIERCFSELEGQSRWLATVRPSDWIDRQPPIGRAAIPSASYLEMTEWALPPEQSILFHRLVSEARSSHDPVLPFLRGASWRAFQTRYREANDLHQQMLRTSRRVHAMADGPDRERALDHLHRGQSNDAYWHGLFGGIYLPDLRTATLRELIRAEDVATDGDVPASVADHDLDGRDEVLLTSPGQTVLVDLAEGGAVGAWDILEPAVPLLSVMRRRPEASHQRLKDARPASATEGGTVGSPHEAVVVKEDGLERLLVYDRHERRSGLVHLIDAEVSRQLGPRELADETFADLAGDPEAAHEIADQSGLASGRLLVRCQHGPLVIHKRFLLAGSRLRPELAMELVVTSEVDGLPPLELDLEWAFCLLGGGSNPQAWYEVTDPRTARVSKSGHDQSGDVAAVTDIAFGNDGWGIRVTGRLEPAARATWYPIETVSDSEAGFERVYQGSSLHFRWPVAPTRGQPERLAVRFAVAVGQDR